MVAQPPNQGRNRTWWWILGAVLLFVGGFFVAEPPALDWALAGLLAVALVGAAISARSVAGRIVLWLASLFLAAYLVFFGLVPVLRGLTPIDTDVEANSPQAASCVGFFDGANEAGDITLIEGLLVECATDSSRFDEVFLGVDEITVSVAYCGFYSLAWDDITHGTEGDFTTFVELTLACDTSWTSPPSEYEAAIERRATILISEGASAFVAAYSDLPTVIEEHGVLLLP